MRAELRMRAAKRHMENEDEQALRQALARLKQEHHDLDTAIRALEMVGGADQLQLTRLKKKKLRIKDNIIEVEDKLLPDIIA